MEENKLSKQEVEEVSGADFSYPPGRFSPVCPDIPCPKCLRTELKPVILKCDSIRENSNGEKEYHYQCPVCGIEVLRPVPEQ